MSTNTCSVTVLTPNGRRMNVKVQPNTTILKILEDVCQKHEFDSNSYDLRHHKRILDLGTMYRFSGLPNNAQLEMVEAQKKRTESEVELVIQLPNGKRLEGVFKPLIKINEIVEKLCPEMSTENNLVAIYMRTEVTFDKMNKTTLKDLGLISGKAIMRLIQRSSDAPKITMKGATIIAQKQISEEEREEVEDRKRIAKRQNQSSGFSLSSALKSVKSEISTSNQETGRIEEKEAKPSSEVDNSEAKVENKTLEIVKEKDVPMEIEDDNEDENQLNVLGERDAVIFSMNSAHTSQLNLPDSFFELNTNDLKLLLKELRTQASGTTEDLLKTTEMRQLEESKEQINKLNQYKTTIIRIQFPDRNVLQGMFAPTDTIETVSNFVQSYLENSNENVVLFITPPKTILMNDQRLFEIGCVPSAVMHFGTNSSDRKQFIKNEFLEKLSSSKAALKLASQNRGLQFSSSGESYGGPSSSQNTSRPKPNVNNFKSSTAASGLDAKVPKWFKNIGK